jgi:hypothetical protein
LNNSLDNITTKQKEWVPQGNGHNACNNFSKGKISPKNAKEFYSNTTTPKYGNGQGAGDSPSQWSQESAILFQLYEEMATRAQMCDQFGENKTTLPMAAFADDMNLLGNSNDNSKTSETLTEEAKHPYKTWNGLLHMAGHFMELSKCSCYLQIWNFQEDGYAYTENPEDHGQEIKVNDHLNKPQIIQQMKANKSQKLLGVMKNPMGDQQDEISRLKKKNTKLLFYVLSLYPAWVADPDTALGKGQISLCQSGLMLFLVRFLHDGRFFACVGGCHLR